MRSSSFDSRIAVPDQYWNKILWCDVMWCWWIMIIYSDVVQPNIQDQLPVCSFFSENECHKSVWIPWHSELSHTDEIYRGNEKSSNKNIVCQFVINLFNPHTQTVTVDDLLTRDQIQSFVLCSVCRIVFSVWDAATRNQ